MNTLMITVRILGVGSVLGGAVVLAQSGGTREAEVNVLPVFDVTATKPAGYGTTNAMGATRMNLALKDTTHSIAVLNRELIDDLGTINAMDALKFVSGVNLGINNSVATVQMRGEEVRFDDGASYIDGLPGGNAKEYETEFLERIEFVKGPAGMLYGAHSLGGVINRVAKRPLPVGSTVLKLTYDSIYRTRQGSFDTTGPLGDAGIACRLIGVMREGESFARGTVDDKAGIYGYVSYARKGQPARVWAKASYLDLKLGYETFSWFFDGAGQPSTFLNPRFALTPQSQIERRLYSYEVGFETSMSGASSVWSMRAVGRYDEQRFFEDAIVPLGYRFYSAAGTLLGSTSTSVAASQPRFSDPRWTDIRVIPSFRRGGGLDRPDRQYGAYYDLIGDFATGPARHKLLAYAQLSGTFKSNLASTTTNYSLPAGYEISIINPRYPSLNSLKNNPVVARRNSVTGGAFNFGLQDNVFLLQDRVILVAGGRYDHARDHGTLNELTGARASERTTNNWIYKGGVVVKPWRNFEASSLFYNYSETFTPQVGTNLAGVPFKNLSGSSHEVGTKVDWATRGVVATVSYFDNRNVNFPVRVFVPEIGTFDFLQLGESYSRGWEADVAWQPSRSFTMLVALSDIDSRNADGTRKRNVQNELNYRLVGKYTFGQGSLKDLAAGAAFVRIGERAGDNLDTFNIEGYDTLDLFVTYGRKRWKAHLNIYNVFDGRGVQGAPLSSIATVQTPFSGRMTLSYSF